MIYSYERRIAMSHVDENWKLNPASALDMLQNWRHVPHGGGGERSGCLEGGEPGLGDQQLECLF